MLTPCHAGDVKHFALLRESIERVDIDLEHLAVIHDEDLHVFQGLRHQKNLTLVPSSAVLGADLDSRRRRGRTRWRRAVPAALGGGVSGWWTQQVVKLAVGEKLGLQDWLCVDSDAVFLRPIDEGALRGEDGRLHLQEHDGLGIGRSVRDFHRVSAAVLDLQPEDLLPGRSYVAWPVPVCGEVIARLQGWLEQRYGLPWVDAFLKSGATEYPLYGYFARYTDGLRSVAPVDRRWSTHLWGSQAASIAEGVRAARHDPDMVMVMVHGGLGVDPDSYRDAVLQDDGA